MLGKGCCWKGPGWGCIWGMAWPAPGGVIQIPVRWAFSATFMAWETNTFMISGVMTVSKAFSCNHSSEKAVLVSSSILLVAC